MSPISVNQNPCPRGPTDLVALDPNPTTATANSIDDATVLETYVNGEPVEIDRSLPTWVD